MIHDSIIPGPICCVQAKNVLIDVIFNSLSKGKILVDNHLPVLSCKKQKRPRFDKKGFNLGLRKRNRTGKVDQRAGQSPANGIFKGINSQPPKCTHKQFLPHRNQFMVNWGFDVSYKAESTNLRVWEEKQSPWNWKINMTGMFPGSC